MDIPDFEVRRSGLWYLFRDNGMTIWPAKDQAPPFYCFSDYLVVAIITARKTRKELQDD